MIRRLTPTLCLLTLAACAPEIPEGPQEYRTTINELLLQDARRCDSGFEYPQSLIDGIGTQLVEELQCLDDTWLVFYEPCRETGCVWADGPQPHAMRPEVYTALQEAGESIDDFISITAAYRDVAMQYYSRWYNENCDSSFDAAIPGQSNHQGGRAIDVRYWDFWWDVLLDHGFEHPIPTDNPHFELVGTAAYRAESEELKSLSILAFQRLWNRNNPDDLIDEDGVYGATTKDRLGRSPVEGFPVGACPPGSGGVDPDPDPEPDVGTDVGTDAGPEVGSDAGEDTGDDSDVGFDTDVEPDAPDDTRPDADPTDVGQPDADVGSDTVQEDTAEPDATSDAADSAPDSTADSGADSGLTDVGSGAEPILPVFSLAADGGPQGRGCTSSSRGPSPAWPALLVGLFFARRRSR